MDSLAHEIIESYETREAGLTALRQDVSMQKQTTQALIEELEITRRATAQQLRAGLAKGHSDLAGGVAAQLTQLDAGHSAMTQELRAGLAKGHSVLAGGVAAQLTQLDAGHRAMTQELRAGLAKGHSDLMGGVAAQLTQVDADHRAMTQELRSHLAEARSSMVQTEVSRKSHIRAWIHGVAATHAGARDAWQNLAAIMQEKRAAPTASDVAPVPLYPAGGPPASPRQIVEIPVENAAGNGEEDGSLSILANSAFAYLADHPDGARLTNLEQELGLGRFQMNQVVRRLTDRGKVEKRDLLYFAI